MKTVFYNQPDGGQVNIQVVFICKMQIDKREWAVIIGKDLTAQWQTDDGLGVMIVPEDTLTNELVNPQKHNIIPFCPASGA